MSDGRMEPPDGEIEAAAAAVPSIWRENDNSAEAERDERSDEQDPFAGGAEDIAADETRRKIELFAWADGVLGLSEAELELALEDAVKRFNDDAREAKAHHRRPPLGKIKAKAKAERQPRRARRRQGQRQILLPGLQGFRSRRIRSEAR